MGNIDHEAIHSIRGVVRYRTSLKEVARINRNNPTFAERKIWMELLSNKKMGYKFLRQKPIHRFIADFYCSELNLIIEIDGESHDTKKERDKSRDNFLAKIGIKTIRFTNEEVVDDFKSVKDKLKVSLVKGR